MTPEELAAARLRKYVEATSAAEGVPEMAAHWEFPFLEKLLEQAHGVLWTCSEYSPPATAEKEEKVADPKAKAKGRASPPPDKKKGGAEEAVEEKKPTPPLFIDLQK